MIDFYNFYNQIECWEQDLKKQEEKFYKEEYFKAFPKEELINNIVSYSRAEVVFSDTLNENIKIWLN
ncbi:MAG: hypothetical protein IKV46_00985 [Bacteroidales bacterium]|jgi:hypothetical protein|nr:hypothetical protein [Bacteroidales bacterium]